MITIVISTLLGAIIASLCACIPGLHVYNVMGLTFTATYALGIHIPTEVLLPLMSGMIVGYSFSSTIPSVLLAAPDETAVFTVLPGQKLLYEGRGYEAVMISAAGSLAGLIILFPVIFLGRKYLVLARSVFACHIHWILWCIIAFMLLSEWPTSRSINQSRLRTMLIGWKSTGAGLLTFLLSGVLGHILMKGSLLSAERAFQNLMPAFVGLFTLPWLLLNIISSRDIPKQRLTCKPLERRSFLSGVFAGTLGGGFAAFFPVITGGVGGMLSGHATALRDDRAFLVSQGASKLVYYVGGFLFFFVPWLGITRGAAASMTGTIYSPGSFHDYYIVLGSTAIAGGVSFLLLPPLTRMTLFVAKKYGYRRLSIAALFLVLSCVICMCGLGGLLVAIVGASIGLIPVLHGSRRMNCLGVILLPMALKMSGLVP